MDTFADRKLEDNSKLEKHREFLHGLINDFNLQIHGTDLDAQEVISRFTDKEHLGKSEFFRGRQLSPRQSEVIGDVSKIIEKIKLKYDDWSTVEQQYLHLKHSSPERTDYEEEIKETDDLISKIKSRLFLGSKSDSDLNAESAFLSKSILFSITLCDIVIDASKRSLDSLRVSDSYSVSLREKAEKMQYTNDSLVEPVDTERSRDLSQLDPERRLSPNSRFKSPKNFDDTQDALEKINQTLHKPKSYFRAEAKRDNNLYDKTENKLLNEAESKSEIFETLRSEMRKIEVLERKIEVPEKKIEVPERKIEVPERKFEFPESKLTAASIPPVELQQKIVTKKSNTANLEAERRPLHSEGKRKKILSDTLPDLEAHRKRMQSHFRERFSKLKQQYATQIQASSGKMVISPASVEVVNDNVQKKEYAPSMPFTQSRVDTVHPREQPIQEVSDDLISEKHSSHNISYEKENDTKADKDIKLQRANLPNTFDQYDNLSTFDDLTKKAEIYLEIELLEESYVIKYPIAIGRNANLPDDRDNTIATPLRNNSNLEGLSDLNYSLSLQGSSVMFPDLAKRKELKQPVKLEERDLNEYDKLKLATRLQTDPELNKLLNKRRFVQAEIEKLRIQSS